jgi:hypothetical protein
MFLMWRLNANPVTIPAVGAIKRLKIFKCCAWKSFEGLQNIPTLEISDCPSLCYEPLLSGTNEKLSIHATRASFRWDCLKAGYIQDQLGATYIFLRRRPVIFT